MAKKDNGVGQVIKVRYQAPDAESGLTVNMKVYDELDAEDIAQTVVMTEHGTSGRYDATFTPDAEGEWAVDIEVAGGEGKLTRRFSVGAFNVSDVGAKVVTVEGKIDSIIANQVSPPMLG